MKKRERDPSEDETCNKFVGKFDKMTWELFRRSGSRFKNGIAFWNIKKNNNYS